MKFGTVTVDNRTYVLEESCHDHVLKYCEEKAASHRDGDGEFQSRVSGPAQEPSEADDDGNLLDTEERDIEDDEEDD